MTLGLGSWPEVLRSPLEENSEANVLMSPFFYEQDRPSYINTKINYNENIPLKENSEPNGTSYWLRATCTWRTFYSTIGNTIQNPNRLRRGTRQLGQHFAQDILHDMTEMDCQWLGNKLNAVQLGIFEPNYGSNSRIKIIHLLEFVEKNICEEIRNNQILIRSVHISFGKTRLSALDQTHFLKEM